MPVFMTFPRAPVILLSCIIAMTLPDAAMGDEWVTTAGRDHALVGRIIDVSTGREISERALFERTAQAILLLLGEKHDNADHHRLQARVLRAFARTRGAQPPALVMEMLNPAQIAPLRAHRRRLVNDVDGLRAILAWDRSGWPSWDIYRPLFAAAVADRMALKAGNLPRSEIRGIGRKGYDAVGDANTRDYLSAHPPSDTERAAIRQTIIASHCGHTSKGMVSGMISIQRARDATMARALITAADASGAAVLVAGTGHIRSDRGVPRFLQGLDAGAPTLGIAFIEVRPGRDVAGDYAAIYGAERLPFDIAWFTPAVDFEDPCVKFRSALERIGRKRTVKPGNTKN